MQIRSPRRHTENLRLFPSKQGLQAKDPNSKGLIPTRHPKDMAKPGPVPTYLERIRAALR